MSESTLSVHSTLPKGHHLNETPLVDTAYMLTMCPHPSGGVTLKAIKEVVKMLDDFRKTFVISPPSREENFTEAEEIRREIARIERIPIFIDVTDMEHLLKMAWSLWQVCLLGSRFRLTS